MKTRINKTVLLMIISLLSLNFVGCKNNSNSNEPDDPFEGKAGIFKVEIEMTKKGNSSIAASGSFTGTNAKAETTKLYKLDGTYIGQVYVFSETMDINNKNITFYTSGDAVNIFGSISFSVEKGNTLSYSIKGYFNDKKVKEISNTIIPTESIVSISENINISMK